MVHEEEEKYTDSCAQAFICSELLEMCCIIPDLLKVHRDIVPMEFSKETSVEHLWACSRIRKGGDRET